MKASFKYIVAALLLLLTVTVSAQKAKESTIYIFGVGTNFADSTVYFSTVQKLENVPLEHKQGLLLNRYAYSEQFYQYLYTQAGKSNETCCVLFATSRAKAEKQYLRIRRRMIKERGQQHIVELPGDAFRFMVVPFIPRTQQQ